MTAALNNRSSGVRRLLELGADHTAVGSRGWCEGKAALEVADQEVLLRNETDHEGLWKAVARSSKCAALRQAANVRLVEPINSAA